MKIPGVRLIALGSFVGPSGGHAFLDFADLPFAPRRLSTIYDVANGETRGNHAHRQYTQLLIASSGACRIMLDDMVRQDAVQLSRPDEGLLVPPLVWVTALEFAAGTALTMLTSGPFDRDEFINSKDELAAMAARPA